MVAFLLSIDESFDLYKEHEVSYIYFYFLIRWPWNHLGNLVMGLIRNICVESILNLDWWLRRRYHLKYFVSTALAAILFSQAELFRQYWSIALGRTFL